MSTIITTTASVIVKLINHHRVTPSVWWENAWRYARLIGWEKTRVGTGGPTHLWPISDAMSYFRRNSGKKNYLTYGHYKRGKGMTASDLVVAYQYVIDLDTSGVASWAQLEIVSRMFPQAFILRTNGIQIFLRPSGKGWDHDVYHLEAMGKMIADMTGLKYDAHHVTKDRRPTKHENHNYRAPIGWSKSPQGPGRVLRAH